MRVRARGLRSNRGGWAWRVHGSRAKSDEKRRTFVLVSCPTACMYIYGIYMGCCNSIYAICALCDVRIYHFKDKVQTAKYAYRICHIGNGRRVTLFSLLCGCHVSPRPLSLSINSGWCLVMTEMLKVWSIGRKSAGKVDQVPPRAPCTEEHAVTVFRYYSEGGA